MQSGRTTRYQARGSGSGLRETRGPYPLEMHRFTQVQKPKIFIFSHFPFFSLSTLPFSLVSSLLIQKKKPKNHPSSSTYPETTVRHPSNLESGGLPSLAPPSETQNQTTPTPSDSSSSPLSKNCNITLQIPTYCYESELDRKVHGNFDLFP